MKIIINNFYGNEKKCAWLFVDCKQPGVLSDDNMKWDEGLFIFYHIKNICNIFFFSDLSSNRLQNNK